MELTQFVGLAGAPVVQYLTELVKRTFPTLKPRWYPAMAVLFGVVLNIALGAMLSTDLKAAAFVGVLTGGLASGMFAVGKVGETPAARPVLLQVSPVVNAKPPTLPADPLGPWPGRTQ